MEHNVYNIYNIANVMGVRLTGFTLTLSPERQSARMSKITNDGLNQVWHKMLYSCNQRMYLMKLLRDQGLPSKELHGILYALVVSKIR